MAKKTAREKQRRAQTKKAKRAGARRERQKEAGHQRARSSMEPGTGTAAPVGAEHLDLPSPRLSPPRPERLLPAVHVDRTGTTVPDPRAVLGLPAGTLDEATVRAAWLAATRAAPPERDPEGARQAREARDRMLSPERWVEREVGVLAAPDADAWGLAVAPPDDSGGRLDAEGRLAAAVVLYALVEDALARAPR